MVLPYQGSNASRISSASLRKSRDQGSVLVLVDPVQARQGLDGGEAGEGLVHIHRVEERLIEAGLELLRHDQDAVVVRVELVCGLRVGKAVHVGLCPVGSAVVYGP